MKDNIIEDVADYLRYRTECGERTVELENETLAAMRAASMRKAATSRPSVTEAPVSAAPSTDPARPMPEPTAPSANSDTLAAIAAECAECCACDLFAQRKQAVPGQGCTDHPDILFVGEAPGADEDEQGLAFVGRAGQLLTKMIAAMGYAREEVFIANICKCRPPGNRTPTPGEMAFCLPFLKRQIALLQPKCIVALGNTAILGLLGKSGIMRLHGVWQSFEGIPLMPTFHPAYLLRLPAAKRDCWKDLQLVMAKLGKPLPAQT